jgi:hypothetical protein
MWLALPPLLEQSGLLVHEVVRARVRVFAAQVIRAGRGQMTFELVALARYLEKAT